MCLQHTNWNYLLQKLTAAETTLRRPTCRLILPSVFCKQAATAVWMFLWVTVIHKQCYINFQCSPLHAFSDFKFSHLFSVIHHTNTHTLTWQCLMKSAATMKLRTSDPSIMELQNWRSQTLSRPLTWTRYRVVT